MTKLNIEFPKNCWYPILEARALKPRSGPHAIQRLGENLVLWRDATGKINCFKDRCPHRGAKLSLGKISNGQLECAYHGIRFQSDGSCSAIPAFGDKQSPLSGFGVQTFVTQEVSGFIWLWWGEQDKHVNYPLVTPELAKVALPLTYKYNATRSMEVGISFFRVIESNMDAYHSAFVHRFSVLYFLGRLFPVVRRNFVLGPIVTGFECKVSDEIVVLRGTLMHEDQKLASEGAPYANWMIFPNQTGVDLPLWRSRGYFVTCPIDSERTWFAGRWSQDFLRVPVLGRCLAWLSLRRLLGGVWKQDERVQKSQDPKISGMGSDQLIFADQGIAVFWSILKNRTR